MQLTKGDLYHVKTLLALINNGISEKELGYEVRPKYKDGTSAYTSFLVGWLQTYDLSKGELPLLSLRRTAWKTAIKEIFWIYQDASNDLELLRSKYGIRYWDDWDIGDGTIGQRYGATVKKYDQLNKLIKSIKETPLSRDKIISLWQIEDLESTKGLNPCCFQTIWSVRGEYLDCTLIQRSSDYITSVSINEIQYIALQMMIAKVTGYKVGMFNHYIQNLHLYDRHREQAKELIRRYDLRMTSKTDNEKPLKFSFNPKTNDFYSFTVDDFTLEGYEPMSPQLEFELGI